MDAIFDTLGDQEVQLILALTFDALKARGLPLPSSLPSSAVKNDIYNNTGFKQIACAGLPQKYDRSPDNLIPTLNLIHIRWQNEVWEPATYFLHKGKTVDLMHKFLKVLLSTIK